MRCPERRRRAYFDRIREPRGWSAARRSQAWERAGGVALLLLFLLAVAVVGGYCGQGGRP